MEQEEEELDHIRRGGLTAWSWKGWSWTHVPEREGLAMTHVAEREGLDTCC